MFIFNPAATPGNGETAWSPVSTSSPIPTTSSGAAAGVGTTLALTSAALVTGAQNVSTGARAITINITSGVVTIDGIAYTGPKSVALDAGSGYLLPAVTVSAASGAVGTVMVLR